MLSATPAPSTSAPSADHFARFVQLAQALAATRKRLDKSALVAAYCLTLDDASLLHAARFLAGQVFAGWDKRRLQLGLATWAAALAQHSGADVDHVRTRLVALGDVGLVTSALWPPHPAPAPVARPDAMAGPFCRDGPLRLTQVAKALADLAQARGSTAKAIALVALWRRANADEGNYIAKLTQGELRTGLQEGALEEALARLAEAPLAAVRHANMLLGDIGETALACRHGTLELAHMRLFHPIKCMLASPAQDASDVLRQLPAPFVAQDKYDGIRAQVHIGPVAEKPTDAESSRAAQAHGSAVGGMRIAIFSRAQQDITAAFPDLLAPLAAFGWAAGDAGAGLVLDGEVIATAAATAAGAETTVAPFSALQTRLGRRAPSAALQAATPVALVAFDVLFAARAECLRLPLFERLGVLEKLPWTPILQLAPSLCLRTESELEGAFAAARARRHEGLVLKNPAAAYHPGRRGRDWLKMKRAQATLDVVVTAAEVGHGRRHKWLSDYTFAVRRSATDPTLLNVGKAYSGLTDAEIGTLTVWFRAHTLATFAHGKVVQVEPAIVLEVTFDRVQASPRHKSGFSLRFPRIVRLRPDKTVADIDVLATVAKLVQVQP